MTGPTGSILIVDDEASMRLTLGMLLRGEGWTVREAAGATPAVTLLEQEPFDVVVTDLRMDDAGGIDVLKTAKRVSPETEVVILTAFGSLGSAVEAVKLGAFDYLSKPFEPDELVVVIRKALERRALLREVDQLRTALEAELGVNRVVAKGAAMRRLFELVRRVAVSDATILIQGESGTGKELIARMVHARSLRASHPFVAVDCGTLPEPLLESELFGHVRGAFTGAIAAKKGLVEEAQGGTVFLDEIDVLPLATQVKLHRVLQERTIRRVGSTASIQVDIRVIVATNRDLATLVRRETFRRGSLLPAERHRARRAAVARSGRGHHPARGALPPDVCRADGQGGDRHHAGGHGSPAPTPLAGERPGAGEGDGTGRGAGRHGRDRPPGSPARAPGARSRAPASSGPADAGGHREGAHPLDPLRGGVEPGAGGRGPGDRPDHALAQASGVRHPTPRLSPSGRPLARGCSVLERA